MSAESIPFLDLHYHHEQVQHELLTAFKGLMQSCRFIGGPEVEEFEKSFAKFCGTEYAVGVGSGTDAVRFALIAAGVKNGDMVITVPNTFIATTEAISQAGAVPLFIDVDIKTMNMSVSILSDFLSEKCIFDDMTGETIHKSSGKVVRAIVPVHLYGQIAQMDQINEIAHNFNLIVIEDACQAHGARYCSEKRGEWVKAGALGAAGAFSFYPGKNLGAFGEAGAVTTNDPNIADTIRMIRDHGQIKKYFHEMEGYNGRLDSIQASVLNTKLPYLSEWNERRRYNAQMYCELLKNEKTVRLPFVINAVEPVYHLFVIRTPYRDMLQSYLYENNIQTALHYPVPLHLQNAYRYLGYTTGCFPCSERLSKEILSLPMYPSLTEKQAERVASCIIDFAGEYSPKRDDYFENEV